jgi:hypothetical protein
MSKISKYGMVTESLFASLIVVVLFTQANYISALEFNTIRSEKWVYNFNIQVIETLMA